MNARDLLSVTMVYFQLIIFLQTQVQNLYKLLYRFRKLKVYYKFILHFITSWILTFWFLVLPVFSSNFNANFDVIAIPLKLLAGYSEISRYTPVHSIVQKCFDTCGRFLNNLLSNTNQSRRLFSDSSTRSKFGILSFCISMQTNKFISYIVRLCSKGKLVISNLGDYLYWQPSLPVFARVYSFCCFVIPLLSFQGLTIHAHYFPCICCFLCSR